MLRVLDLTADGAEGCRGVDVQARRRRTDVVQAVEELRLEIEVLFLGHEELLAYREGEVEEDRAAFSPYAAVDERAVGSGATLAADRLAGAVVCADSK